MIVEGPIVEECRAVVFFDHVIGCGGDQLAGNKAESRNGQRKRMHDGGRRKGKFVIDTDKERYKEAATTALVGRSKWQEQRAVQSLSMRDTSATCKSVSKDSSVSDGLLRELHRVAVCGGSVSLSSRCLLSAKSRCRQQSHKQPVLAVG